MTTTTTSVLYNSSPEDEVRCCIRRTRVGQEENTHQPPSSWETTAAVLQMFLTNNKAMNIFTDARGHDRLSLIYRPFTIEEEEEVTFSEEEDVSAEKGRKGGRMPGPVSCDFVHEPSLSLLLTDDLKCTYMRSDGGFLGVIAPGLSQSQKLPEVLQSMNDSLIERFLTCQGCFSCTRQSIALNDA